MLNSSEPMNIDPYVHLILVSANRAMSEGGRRNIPRVSGKRNRTSFPIVHGKSQKL